MCLTNAYGFKTYLNTELLKKYIQKEQRRNASGLRYRVSSSLPSNLAAPKILLISLTLCSIHQLHSHRPQSFLITLPSNITFPPRSPQWVAASNQDLLSSVPLRLTVAMTHLRHQHRSFIGKEKIDGT
ncbi:hypothetical protein J1N35_021906 [Gossypium stocksii]|uniref:Uncharacterized protein n=1 Tax=Gossypium stocksii TaxID=47602 RepID=A0A9D3VF47_9ROSI|nr:hypothetical protein J1N35_021906 [Gossypium stocksii]